jgi:hypothetical protein
VMCSSRCSSWSPPRWLDNKGADGVVHYSTERNAVSLDGLPGMV